MSRPWMPLYPADFLADTMHLSAAEVGAYMLLIMHYWQRGGLPNDDDRVRSIARTLPEQWASCRAALREFFNSDWTHDRIDAELVKAEEKYQRRAEAGRAGGNAKAARQQSPSNASGNALAEGYQPQPHSIPNGIEEPAHAKPASRGTRLPPEWKPSEVDIAYAVSKGMPQAVITSEAEKFRNYWVSKTGKDATKADWPATWQNWILRTCEQKGYAPVAATPSSVDRRLTEFVLDSDPRWSALAERWLREKGRPPPKADGRNECGTGQGWHFAIEWIEDLKVTEKAE